MLKFYICIFISLFQYRGYSQSFKNFKIEENTYKLNLNNQQGASSTNIEYDEEKNEVLRSVEKPLKQIEIFDLKTGNLKRIIKTKVNKLGSFKKISDSLFWIHDPIIRTYFLIDKSGIIKKSLKEPDFSNNLIYLHTSAYSFSPIVFYKNTLYVTGRVMFKDVKSIDLNVFKTTGIVEQLNINGTTGFVGRPATKNLHNFYGNMNNYSSTLNKNILICAPHFSDELILINLDNKEVKRIQLKTKYEALIKPLSSLAKAGEFTNSERNEYFKYSYTNIGFVYDKYRDVYYRFVRYPQKSYEQMECSIIVFDKNFNLLFEKTIDHKKYNASKFLITKQGLAILNINKYRQNDSALVFDLFSLTN